MSCPKCDHTMQCVNVDGQFFWCPNCGSLKQREVSGQHGDHEWVAVPVKYKEIALWLDMLAEDIKSSFPDHDKLARSVEITASKLKGMA